MWDPTSLIINLVSVGWGDTFFFFWETALSCIALICSVLSNTWEADLAVKANSPKDTVWSEAFASCQSVPSCSVLKAKLSSLLGPFLPYWVLLLLGSLPVYLYRYQRWLPALINFRKSSWCFWAKRNQWKRKEPSVSRYLWFPLSHSFPYGMVKLSLIISIQTARLIASFEKMEQSGHIFCATPLLMIQTGFHGAMQDWLPYYNSVFLCIHDPSDQQCDSEGKYFSQNFCSLSFLFLNQYFYLFIYLDWLSV